MREALLYEKLENETVRCEVCRRACVIPQGELGACGTRQNRGGTLYTLVYGLVSSACVDPIEKKPLYHFYPGTSVFSLGTVGCNFRCPGCQNASLSRGSPRAGARGLFSLSPQQCVELAIAHQCQGICWTYNEPTIWFEHTLETARLARERGLYTAYVTNGFISRAALDAIGPYLDAFRVDIKAFSQEAYRRIAGVAALEGVLDSTLRAKEHWGMHVECVTNVTPTLNDDPQMLRSLAQWIRDSLGPHTPWHVTRFYPHLELSHLPPTPVRLLEEVYEMARAEGLFYVYVGNLPGHAGEDTYCHACGTRVIRRQGMTVAETHLDKGTCRRCGTRIPGRFSLPDNGPHPT